MAQCEFDVSNEELNRGGFRGIVVTKNPDQKICRPLVEMGIFVPLCPFDPDQKADCPLAQAARGEIPVIDGINKFYAMAPCLKAPTD